MLLFFYCWLFGCESCIGEEVLAESYPASQGPEPAGDRLSGAFERVIFI